jgi:hypothetical protein
MAKQCLFCENEANRVAEVGKAVKILEQAASAAAAT